VNVHLTAVGTDCEALAIQWISGLEGGLKGANDPAATSNVPETSVSVDPRGIESPATLFMPILENPQKLLFLRRFLKLVPL
jgi:hypothetical protein